MRIISFIILSGVSAISGWSNSTPLVIKTLSDLNPRSIARETSAHVNTPSATDANLKHNKIALEKNVIIEQLDDYLDNIYQTEFDIQLDTELYSPLGNEEQSTPVYTVENIQLNTNQTRLKAELVFNDANKTRLTFNARVAAMHDVPVLARGIKPGEIITEQDITWQKMPAQRLQGNVIIAIADIVGRQPRSRLINPNTPLHKHDLIKQELIKRGTMVMAQVDNSGINIQMQAKAMDAGSAGDVIRVQNIDSHKILKGIIQDTGLVKIQTASTILAAANL